MIHQADGIAELQAIERDRYVILIHLYTYRTSTHSGGLSPDRIDHDLGFGRTRSAQLLRDLMRGGYIKYVRTGEALTLSEFGRRYIEQFARRRRSVRLVA